ncbi:MAG: helix-turn-helix transcriptional regulator [Methanoregula sp.]|nr:helix-turn-helix transcriptional regulator [Methanoregula sp.]
MNPGEILKSTRTAAKLTQLQLAARAHVDTGTISRIERGTTRPRAEVVAKIEEALETRIWSKESHE